MIFYFSSAILGLIILFCGIKLGLKFYVNNDLIVFNLVEGEINFEIPKSGYYSIGLIGGFYAENFSLNLKKNEEVIDLEAAFPKEMFVKNGINGKIYFNFMAKEKGNYLLYVNDFKSLKVWNNLQPSITNPFSYFEKPVSKINLSILIKRYVAPLNLIGSILLSIIGLSIFLFTFLNYLEKVGFIVIPK